MVKKLTDPKVIEKLALLAAWKTGPGDNIDDVARKVISDYFAAKDAVKKMNEEVSSQKIALKLEDKRREKMSKTKVKPKKQAVGE